MRSSNTPVRYGSEWQKVGDHFTTQRPAIVTIGPAGENKSRIACLIHGAGSGAGQGGFGGVFGSKNLKAIAVMGTGSVKIADPKALRDAREWFESSWPLEGHRGPGRNMNAGVSSCRGCHRGCRNRKELYGMDSDACTESIWYSLASPPFERTPQKYRYKACDIVQRLGINATDSCFGGALTFPSPPDHPIQPGVPSTTGSGWYVKRLYDMGIIGPGKEVDTYPLPMDLYDEVEFAEAWGTAIAKRIGIGDLLAEGTKRVAAKLDKGAERFAMHVKGLELPAYDPRAAKICGLAFATANRGGDHITAYVEGPAFVDTPFLCVEDSRIEDWIVENPAEAKVVKDLEDALTVFDCMGTCKFMGMALAAEDWVDMIANCVGWELSASDFRKIGERVYNLARAFNVREGLTRADDTLPRRLFEDPLPEGAAEGHTVRKLDESLDAYYEFRGLDKETGKPTPEKLKSLNLDYIIGKM